MEPVTYRYGTLLAEDPGGSTEKAWQDWDLCRILLGEETGGATVWNR